MKLFGEQRTGFVGAGLTAATLTVLSLGVMSPAAADDGTISSPAVSAKAQASYETQLSEFLRETPEPASVSPDAPAEEQNAYWDAMASWWQEVPWEAVAGQWGCTAGEQEVQANPVNSEGVTTYGHGGVMQCAVQFEQDELASVAQVMPRTEAMARFTDAETRAAIKRCDAVGGDKDLCLSRPASGSSTLTASMQWLLGSAQTGRARLGHVGVSGCGAGSQLAVGALGTGGYATVWYATGTAAYNASFSSQFLLTNGSVYGTFCAIT